MAELSVIIPSRNEPYLQKTIDDILVNSSAEIIVILDGYWPNPPLKDNDRLHLIHRGESRGMRNGINSAVAMARTKYIMKLDAHCMLDKDFDTKFINDYQPETIIVPRRKRLDPETWTLIEGKPDVDYEYIDPEDLHGVVWNDKAVERKNVPIDEIISAQGSCYFTEKDYFEKLGGLDDKTYGSFFLEFQELSFKTWFSGGRVLIDKNTWYAHWHKSDGRGYSLKEGEREKAREALAKWKENPKWNETINKFLPMPGWTQTN